MTTFAHYENNTHAVELRGLVINGVEVTTGTATAAIWNLVTDQLVTGSTITLTYAGPTGTGLWRGLMPAEVALSAGGSYELRVTIDSQGARGYWTPSLQLTERH